MGLDNAGKTSITLSLKGDKNLLTYYNLEPTKSFKVEEIHTGDVSFHVWDCGGQELYRNTALRDFQHLSAKTSKLIYVIDVQARDRYEAAVAFFQQVILKFQELDVEVPVSVFLHKFDPALEQEPQYADAVLKERLVDPITTALPAGFPLKIFKTTIYTVFKKALLT